MKKLRKNIRFDLKYNPAMQIIDPEKAAAYFELLVENTMSWGHTREEAEEIERSNLGQYAGPFGHETRLRVERLFKCSHPYFGKAKENVPTPEEAFQKGIDFAQRAK